MRTVLVVAPLWIMRSFRGSLAALVHVHPLGYGLRLPALEPTPACFARRLCRVVVPMNEGIKGWMLEFHVSPQPKWTFDYAHVLEFSFRLRCWAWALHFSQWDPCTLGLQETLTVKTSYMAKG